MSKEEFVKLLEQLGYEYSGKNLWVKAKTIIQVNKITYTKLHKFNNGIVVQVESPYFSQHRSL